MVNVYHLWKPNVTTFSVGKRPTKFHLYVDPQSSLVNTEEEEEEEEEKARRRRRTHRVRRRWREKSSVYGQINLWAKQTNVTLTSVDSQDDAKGIVVVTERQSAQWDGDLTSLRGHSARSGTARNQIVCLPNPKYSITVTNFHYVEERKAATHAWCDEREKALGKKEREWQTHKETDFKIFFFF